MAENYSNCKVDVSIEIPRQSLDPGGWEGVPIRPSTIPRDSTRGNELGHPNQRKTENSETVLMDHFSPRT